jgi:mRNA-degrading endonuclease toxin of MazEF toxin-antitoxin module
VVVTRRGDVVLVNFPFPDTGQSKVRPAVAVQNDRDNQKIRKTVIAMVTGNLQRRGDPSHVFIDPADPEGSSSGLRFPSLVSCNNLFTVDQGAFLQQLGHLSDDMKQRLDAALKAALDLP